MKKRTSMKLTAITAAAILSLASGITSYAGWGSDDGGDWYLFDSNAYARDQIIEIDGVTYGFDSSAYLMYGWHYIDGSWHYFDETSGSMATGWLNNSGKWYYMEPETGAMHTGWIVIGSKKYYMDSSGAMQTGLFAPEGSAYLYETNDDGSLITNMREPVSPDGNIYEHLEDGRIRYKTANTALTDEPWQMLMTEEYQAGNIDYQKELLYQEIIETEDSLYDRYQDYVLETTGSTARANRRSKWEASAEKKLSELGVSQSYINIFIYNVEHDNYDSGHETDSSYEFYFSD